MNIAEKLTTVAENMQQIYNKGFADGQAQGGGGSDNWYDTFWDSYQDKGNRTDYDYAFRFGGWNNTTFKPKHKMYPTTAPYMFYFSQIEDGNLINEYVDFSNCTKVDGCFGQNKNIKSLPVLDFSKVSSSLSSTFAAMSSLESIEKIIVDFSSGITFNTNTFNSDAKLKEIRFEGTIEKDIYLQLSPLSVESMKDIISHLKNHKGTDNDGLYTISFSSACWDALEANSTAPDGGNWKNYVSNLGWLI